MKRLSDEELVLYYYGEAPDPKEIERALESSKEERRRYAELSRVLDTVDEPPIPEKSAAYGASVWRRLEPQLEKKSWLGSWSWEALVRPARVCRPGTVIVLADGRARAIVTGRGEAGRREVTLDWPGEVKTLLAAYAFVNRIPCSASWSRWGV